MKTFYELLLMTRDTKLHGTEIYYCSSARLEPSIHLGYSSRLLRYFGFSFRACGDSKFSL